MSNREMEAVELGVSDTRTESNKEESPNDSNNHGQENDEVPTKLEHVGNSRQYWRDIILGVNDGLISTFLLIAAVAGGGLAARDILLTALAGGMAGAVSMAAGEYVATKSQNQVLEGEILIEREHIRCFLNDEMEELKDLLVLIGLDKDKNEALVGNVLDYYRTNPEDILKAMIALEFGVVEREIRKPVCAAAMSGFLFFLGSLPTVIPFLFSNITPLKGLISAAFLTTFCLLGVGVIKTWVTRCHWLNSAVENLVIAGIGGGFAYGVGAIFAAVVGGETTAAV